MTESVDIEYTNLYIYSLLSGSTYIELARKLKNAMKCLINIKKNDNKWFLWYHISYLNPLKIHLERIIKADKNMINNFDYNGIDFPISKTDFGKIEKKNIALMFCY